MSTSRDSKLKQLYRRKFYGRNNIIYVHREQFNRNPKNYSRFIKQFVHDIITSISWYLQVINFLYYYHYSRCIMKIILLYTRHWTTDVGPLKWFGQNCTTELATIQQVCTRVLQIKIVLLCNYFLQGSWWNAQRYFKPVSFHSVWDVETKITGGVWKRENLANQTTAFDEQDVFLTDTCPCPPRYNFSDRKRTLLSPWHLYRVVTQLPHSRVC